ncbi:MAG: aminoacyl-tRNA hydrolase [Planctomycetes bacterium]|nr:aminoacyl-tRNA hydrolase [Planctomycetota bacterium]
MKLIVGLGNPGGKYEGTRHNIGFEVVEQSARRHGADAGRKKFDGELQECLIGSERTLLLRPHTFMNLSGRSVRQAVDFYKIETEDLLLVCDDFHLDLGVLRLRGRGSDGGQKGLADTIRQLGTDQFARLRVGIGPVPDRWNAADFVLGKFAKTEQKTLESEIIRICDAVDAWVSQGITAAMNGFNG